MRSPRIKTTEESTCYHLLSRTSRGVFLFGDSEKEQMRSLLWRTARFCGIEIITYALMSNHFHLLVRVPAKAAADAALTDAEVLDRMSEFRSDMEMGILKRGAELAGEMQRKLAAGEGVDVNTKNWGENWLAVRESMVAQMHEVSQFMKLFKQRVGIWFNRSKATYANP